MAAKNRNISTLIESQLPGFIASEYENFSNFLEKYYEQLESQGQPLDIISNITTYRDINYYEKNLLNQFTSLTANLENSTSTIKVEDASSFPKENGYVKIGSEICFYKSRTDTEFLEVSRGVSGNNTIGDLYDSSEFVTTQAEPHYVNDKVYNISNLFLYAFVKSFEAEYLAGFPEKYLKPEVDKRSLIKNISSFYKAKGTDKSIKFIFNSIVSKSADDVPELYYPKDFTLKASTSDWINNFSLKVKVLSGDITKLIGNKIIQQTETSYASAVVDNVLYAGATGVYELILNPSSVNGDFKVAAKTTLRSDITVNNTIGNRIDVFSTQGWDKEGAIIVNNEVINFLEKNVNQFVISQRSNPNTTHIAGTEVYSADQVNGLYDGGSVSFLTLGILYNLLPSNSSPYSESGDKIQIYDEGSNEDHPVINDNRWFLNTNFRKAFSSLNQQVSDAIGDLNSDVSAIYEDDQYFYICSSGYPHHGILKESSNFDLGDQKILRLIRKYPVSTTEVYQTSTRDIGIFVDGSIAFGYKDFDYVLFGNIVNFNIINKGTGYVVPPFVLINDEPYKARAILSGEVIDSIEIDEEDIYTSNPEITITSGRNAKVRPVITNGEITSIIVVDPGEYYSSPPTIRIIDALGRGNFAEYEAVVSSTGQLVECKKINGGKFYDRNSIIVDVIPTGSGAYAEASIKKWIKDRYNSLKLELDTNNGSTFPNYNPSFRDGYGVVANPSNLRFRLSDNINNVLDETNAPHTHSPILGFAYDGYPIYGPYGYSDPVDSNSSVSRLSSGYQLVNNRVNGPSTSDYPLGTFIDDYRWVPSVNSNKTELDQNNGRFCVTPEYPNGTYAYFVSIDSNGTPVFPYILGENFYGIPVDSNYNSNISQNDLPKNVKRVTSSDFEKNGSDSFALIQDVKSGFVDSLQLLESTNTFSVGGEIFANNDSTSGFGLNAQISSVKGKNVVSLESEETKALLLNLETSAYLFEGDILFQGEGILLNQIIVDNTDITENILSESPNVKIVNDLRVGPNTDARFRVIRADFSDLTQGEIIGDVINDNQVVLRSTNGVFDTSLPIFSSIRVLSLLVDKSSTYTEGAVLSFIRAQDGAVLGSGFVIEGTLKQNTVKVRIITGEFFVSDDFVIKSSEISDTANSKVIFVTPLSENLNIVEVKDNIAIIQTNQDHNVGVGDNITVDIIPDDVTTETVYEVRKRLYQKIILEDLQYSAKIQDKGIGRFEILNTGSDYEIGTYTNVELVFVDQTKTRINIGDSGDSGNAIVNLTVTEFGGGYGGITTIEFVKKGSGYKKGDILTVSDVDVPRLQGSLSTFRFNLVVDHVGFASDNTSLQVDNVNNISKGDYLQISSEILLIEDVNKTDNILTVGRGYKGTSAIDHVDGQIVKLEDYTYNLPSGYQFLGSENNKPEIVSYDKETRELLVAFNYNVSNPNTVLNSSIFYDQSAPAKFVNVQISESPKFVLEFLDSEQNILTNPTIDIQKYYKYKFDTSHSSMTNTYLDFSSSLNYNLYTEEKVVSSISPGIPGSFVSLKIGFGPNLSTNQYDKKVPTKFTNYFYFIKTSSDVDTNNAYLRVIEDPLSGVHKSIYSTNRRIVYELNSIPQYDGSGTIEYSTDSQFAIGAINTIQILNGGQDYKKIPVCSGILPTPSYEALATVNVDPISKSISAVIVNNQGKNYSKPVALLTDGNGSKYEFDCLVEDGRVKQINVISGGSNFDYIPTVKIYESDVKVYFGSNTIGVPQNVKFVRSGQLYNNDKTTLPKFKSNTTFVVSNFEDNSFYQGEELRQIENGVVTATCRVAKNGWRIGSNLLKVENITGIFKNGSEITGVSRNKTATIIAQYTTEFTPDIKSYSNNLGYFKSNRGKLSENSQKISDSYFYQDFSYVIKSRTPIDFWRDLIRETTHPAGFQLFGEVLVESNGNNRMPDIKQTIETHSFINLEPKNISVVGSRKYIVENILAVSNTNVERGIGSVSVDTFDNSETVVVELILGSKFDGGFAEDTGILRGTTAFTLLDAKKKTAYAPYSENSLIVTIDGVLQEPGKSFVVRGNQIIFSEPPLGERVVEGQLVEAQKFYCKSIKFKDNTLNQKYIKKLKNISNQFDGQTKIFDLYYEDGSLVKSDLNEKFIVALNGVLQNARSNEEEPFGNAYSIIRNEDLSVTDKIQFTKPPISHGSLYSSQEDDTSIEEECFIYSIGSYIRCTIDSKTIKYRGTGPYLILDELKNSVVNVDDSSYAVVFIDGVLQIPGKSYDIVGPNITFSSPLRYYEDESGKQILQKVSILLFYGRDKAKTLTFYDFEPDTYYSEANLIIEGSPDTEAFYSWFANYVGENIVVLQNNSIIGKIKLFDPDPDRLNLTLLCSSFNDLDSSDFTFVNHYKNDKFTLSSPQSSNITYNEDENGFRTLKVNVPFWLYGSNLGEKAHQRKSRLYSNLNIGDLIQIDGESSYREIVSIPELVNTKQYNKGEFISSDIYSKIKATNYNDIVRGEGLAITAEIDADGTIIKLNWNRRDLSLYFNNNLLLQPTAYQYYTPPIIDFVPRTPSGGGAKAEVISVGGQIVDIVLIDGGYGYEEPPKVVVSRGYNKIKSTGRKIDTTTVLNVSPQVAFVDSLTSSSEITLTAYGPSGQAVFSYINLSAEGGVKTADEEITAIVMPEMKVVTIREVESYIVADTFYAAVIIIETQLQSVTGGIVNYIETPFNIISSSTLTTEKNEVTNIIHKQINKAITQVDTASINDIGAYLDAPLSETDTIVYIPDTRRFPDSSRLLIGKEIVYYERKKSDRFLDVTRGADGTTAQTHEAGDYLRHLPKLVSVVSGGVFEVQLITSIESSHDTFREVLKVIRPETIEQTVVYDSTLLTRDKQINVDNSDVNIINSIAIIPPPSYNVITTIHSTASNVQTIVESSRIDSIYSSIITLNETNINVSVNQNINVDISDIVYSMQIVSNEDSSIQSVSSRVLTLEYNETIVENQVNILSNIAIENYSSVYILQNNSTIESIVSSTNTIQNVIKEIAIIPPESYAEVRNLYSSTSISKVPVDVTNLQSAIVTVSQAELILTSDLNINIIDTNAIIVSTQIDAKYESAHITSISSSYVSSSKEISSAFVNNIDTSFTSHSSGLLIVANNIESTTSVITTVNVYDVVPPFIIINPLVECNYITSATIISAAVNPNVSETTVRIDTATSTNGSSSIEFDRIAGAIDYPVESIILASPMQTRNNGLLTLEEPFNVITSRDNTTIEVNNKPSERDSFYNNYNLGNAGNTLRAFENLAFINTGAFAVTGSIADLSLAFPDLTINDFGLQSYTAYTTSGEYFNFATPTINEIGSLLASNVLISDTEIVLSNASGFPDVGTIIVNKEIINYTSKSGNTLLGLTRGADNTIPSQHTAGDYLRTF